MVVTLGNRKIQPVWGQVNRLDGLSPLGSPLSVHHCHGWVSSGIFMQKEPTWPSFLILLPIEHLYRIHSSLFTLSPSDSNALWITPCLSRFHLPLCALMFCFRIILKYPRLVPVGAIEKVSICLTGMDEVFTNFDLALILLLCDTGRNELNELPPSKIFTQNLPRG